MILVVVGDVLISEAVTVPFVVVGYVLDVVSIGELQYFAAFVECHGLLLLVSVANAAGTMHLPGVGKNAADGGRDGNGGLGGDGPRPELGGSGGRGVGRGRGSQVGGPAERAFCDRLFLEEALKAFGLPALEAEGLVVLRLGVHGVRAGPLLAADAPGGGGGESLGDEGAEGGLCDEVVVADVLEAVAGPAGDLHLGKTRLGAGGKALLRLGRGMLVDAEGGRGTGEVGLRGVGLEALSEGAGCAHRGERRGRGRGRGSDVRGRSRTRAGSATRAGSLTFLLAGEV